MRGLAAWVLIASLATATAATSSAQGIFFPGAGPINTSMAGASTAAPVDVGASYWNPATISGLDRSEFMIGSGLVIPSIHLSTFLPADSLSSTLPSSPLSGQARSNSGATAAPYAAVAFRLHDDDAMTYGIGLFSFYGGGVNFPSGAATSLLGPGNLPKAQGFGSIYSSLYGLLFAPTASYRFSDRLSLAFGPTVAETALSLDPFFFSSGVKDANGAVSFPMGSAGKTNWGGGFQVGMLYEINESWNVGFSYKSPIWQERFNYNATFPNGAPRRVGIEASIPEIFSWGVAYKGLPKTLIDVDLRYFDYANADLFGRSVTANGAGWRSILAVAVGAQYEATDRLTLRCGYLYNQNPIPAAHAYSNFQLPAIVTNTLTVGGTYKITDDVSFSASYLHGFRNAISGPIAGIRGSSVGLDAQTDTLYLGFNFQFGGKRRKDPAGEAAPA
ncbi:MAG TPA: outer membrane protein transport protein, partial [Isosphaeraceae bacterium]